MSQKIDYKNEKRVDLPGSERAPFNAEPSDLEQMLTAPNTAASEAGSASEITVTVLVPRKKEIDPESLGSGEHMSREEFAEKHGPRADSLEKVEEFARQFGLRVEKPSEPGRRSLHLSGSKAQMEEAFGVQLQEQTVAGARLRVRQGSISLPQSLTGSVDAVLGLDNRPVAKPHLRRIKAHAVNVSYTPVQVASLYGFPSGAKAAGQTIGIIELGGGFKLPDIQTYFTSLGLPVPSVTAVSVDGGLNAPATPPPDSKGADGEVMLDIEVCAAVAPGAKIVVYFAPNTDQGFADAISTAAHDAVNKPSVISISWGGPESSWTTQAINAMESSLQAAAVLGVTVTAASGDDGATDGVSGTAKHVDFPAASPYALACGGTKLTGTGSTISSEVVWNELSNKEGATGGGFSSKFSLPTWQKGVVMPATATMRGVPDVAGDADPTTGYRVRVDGQNEVIGGTSAVAPLWAGLIALANAANGKAAGFANPKLYKAAKTAFHDITSGYNGSTSTNGFSAATGWDACTGLGTPKGAAVIAALKN